MTIVLSASRMMTAYEVRLCCMHLRNNKLFVRKIENAAKQKIALDFLTKEKAASAGTLTATVHN